LGLDLIQLPLAGGPPDPLLATSRNEALPDMTASGMLAYVTDAEGPSEVRVRSGADAWPRTIGGARGAERERATQPRSVRLSPDGQRLAVDTFGSDHLIWIYPTAGGSPVRLDAETTDQHGSSWSPDGNWIAYRRMHNGKWQLAKAPLGGGPAVRLADSVPGGGVTDWSPRGDWIAHAGTDGLHLVSPAGASRLFTGLRTAWFRFSRDGSQLFAIRRAVNRRLELSIWDVQAGRELRSVPLPLPATTDTTVRTARVALDSVDAPRRRTDSEPRMSGSVASSGWTLA
jgi:dipeptidyl aminopeptidase/acylaminoacyl peptidase